jgi:hypothetical protein
LSLADALVSRGVSGVCITPGFGAGLEAAGALVLSVERLFDTFFDRGIAIFDEIYPEISDWSIIVKPLLGRHN